MGNREYYEKKLEVISTLKDSQIKKTHHIPVAEKNRCQANANEKLEFSPGGCQVQSPLVPLYV